MPETLYVAWQDEKTRTWYTIARLWRNDSRFELAFTRGAERLGNLPEKLFHMSSNYRYQFDQLIHLFSNKIPSRSRPDFKRMLRWLNLTGTEDDFGLLAKFGLIPGTDNLLVYSEPRVFDNNYSLEFFIHGVRQMHPHALALCDSLREGDELLPLLDVKNPVDTSAVAIRCQNEFVLLGYVPTFYADDLSRLLTDRTVCSGARVSVIRNNRDAPVQLRILCKFEAIIPAEFKPLDTSSHKLPWELASA